MNSELQSFQFYISHISYPVQVFGWKTKIQSGYNVEDALIELETQIRQFALSDETNPISLKGNARKCIALFDSIWRRGVVMNCYRQVNVYIFEVYFIDYGNIEVIPHNLCIEMPDLFSTLPALASQYGIYNVLPLTECLDDRFLRGQWLDKVNSNIIKLRDIYSPGKIGLLCNVTIKSYIGITPFISCAILCIKNLAQTEISLSEYLISNHLFNACSKRNFMLLSENNYIIEKDEKICTTTNVSSAYSFESPLSQLHKIWSITCPPNIYYPQSFCNGENIPPQFHSLSNIFAESFTQRLKFLSFPGPNLVQSYVWPILLAGLDLLLISPPKSGKTLAYLLPLLNNLLYYPDEDHANLNGPILLILSNSLTNAEYVYSLCKKIISWNDPARVHKCIIAYNGNEASILEALGFGIDVLTGTPASIAYLVNTNVLSLSRLRYLVFDNADRLVEHFQDEIKLLMKKLRQSFAKNKDHISPVISIFSSFYSRGVMSLMRAYTNNRTIIIPCPLESAVFNNLKQVLIRANSDEKLTRLADILVEAPISHIIIYLAQLDSINDVNQMLLANNMKFYVLLSSLEINHILEMFNNWERDHDNQQKSVLIILDESLEKLSVYLSYVRVDSIIHYEFPNSKRFKNIFSLRHLAFVEKFNSTPLNSCTSYIFLNKDLGVSVSYILDFHIRLGNTIPNSICNKMTRLLDNSKSNSYSELCYYYKAYGLCPQNYTCLYSHTIDNSNSMKTDQIPPFINTPASGIISFYVANVSNPSQLWIRILDHFPTHLGDPTTVITNYISQYIVLNRELQEHYRKDLAADVFITPQLGNYYSLYDSNDNKFYRVKTLYFSRPLSDLFFSHYEQIEVRCIDTGELKVADANQLFHLPNHLLQIPCLVNEVIVCNIKPNNEEFGWSSTAIDFSRAFLNNKEMVGNVLYSCNGCLWIDIIYPIKLMPTLKLTATSNSYARELIYKHLAIANPDHTRLLNMTRPSNKLDIISNETLDINTKVEVIISAVDTPHHFYIQKESNLTYLSQLNSELNEAKRPKFTFSILKPNHYCAAVLPYDNLVYRGKILSVTDDFQYEILFIDYGDAEIVISQNVFPISASYLQMLPAQAIMCSLEDIVDFASFSYERWKTLGDTFWDITRRDVLAIPNSLSIANNTVSVELFCKSNTGFTNVRNFLYDTCDAKSKVFKNGNEVDDVSSSVVISDIDSYMCSYLNCSDLDNKFAQLQKLLLSICKLDNEIILELNIWEKFTSCVFQTTYATHQNLILNALEHWLENTGNQNLVRLCQTNFLKLLPNYNLADTNQHFIVRILNLISKCDYFFRHVQYDLLEWLYKLFLSMSIECRRDIFTLLNGFANHSENSAMLLSCSQFIMQWKEHDTAHYAHYVNIFIQLLSYSTLKALTLKYIDVNLLLNYANELLSLQQISEESISFMCLMFKLITSISKYDLSTLNLLKSNYTTINLMLNKHKYSIKINNIIQQLSKLIANDRKNNDINTLKTEMKNNNVVLPTNESSKTIKTVWSQSKSTVTISCKVLNAISGSSIISTESVLTIHIWTNIERSEFTINLYASVKQASNKYIYGTEVVFKYIKFKSKLWPRLANTLEEQKALKITIDFDRFRNLSSSSDEERDYQNSNVRKFISTKTSNPLIPELDISSNDENSDVESQSNSDNEFK